MTKTTSVVAEDWSLGPLKGPNGLAFERSDWDLSNFEAPKFRIADNGLAGFECGDGVATFNADSIFWLFWFIWLFELFELFELIIFLKFNLN